MVSSAAQFLNPARVETPGGPKSFVKILRGVWGSFILGNCVWDFVLVWVLGFCVFPYELLSRRCQPHIENPDPKAGRFRNTVL